MPNATTPTAHTARLREFFTLAGAERAAAAYDPAQGDRVQACFAAAERRRLAGRKLVPHVPACVLLRDAVLLYLCALRAARDGAMASSSLEPAEALARLPPLEPDPLRPGAAASDDARVRDAVRSDDPLQFDCLAPDDVALTRAALERAAGQLRRGVEARSVRRVRAERWTRWAAMAGLVVYAAVAAARWFLLPPNVALNKPVTPSSVWYVPAAGQTLVDGETGSSFGVHTKLEDSPSVVIDLQDIYRIHRVAVHNRVDGWFDDCLPLVVELSADGRVFHEIGRRTTHFDGSPPWVVDAGRERARFVRLRVDRRSYLALSEVEVFGKKK